MVGDAGGATPTRGPSTYLAAAVADAFERERLGLLGRLMDPMSTRRLDRLGVAPGWRCLEVGAGDGSVARWLVDRVGPAGHVVATDLDPRFLDDPRIEVRAHDILVDPLETGAYDLVHCRAVLMHLSQPKRALARMAAALRPGGWLLVEEGDVGTCRAADPSHPAAEWFQQAMKRGAELIQATGLVDVRFGRRCRGLLEEVGLVDVEDETTTWKCRGGGQAARFQQMNLRLVQSTLPSFLPRDDYERQSSLYEDASFAFVFMAMVGAWGRRPHSTA